MNRLDFGIKKILGAEVGPESSLPPIAQIQNLQQQTLSDLGEEDGLYIGYGFVSGSFPYRQLDRYSRELKETAVRTAVLENEFLRAEFLPEWGGRLWSLFDKKAGRELTYSNPVIRPCNLAIRNAWLAGGVEWNSCMVGHHPFTCSPLFTARLQLDDGTPVLRFYEFERVRRAVIQMDFFLPEASPLLYARMRIVNPNTEVVPMYWWSNIAVPESPGARVVVDADEAYVSHGGHVGKVGIPVCRGKDVTYPVNNANAVDYFWKIPDIKRKYAAYLDNSGYGLIQTSTGLLRGRKLFVWGQRPGGSRWQEYLTSDGSEGRYVEVQAGLAHTQYECLPMPPKTAWEWMEAYGAMEADPARVHGDWENARSEVTKRLDSLVSEAKLEELLKKTHDMAISPAEEVVLQGSGWGALELLRRSVQGEAEFCPQLDFGSCGTEQADWVSLLQDGFLSPKKETETPSSWMSQKEWADLLQEAADGPDAFHWYVWLQLGMARYAQGNFAAADTALFRSMELSPSCWALYGLAQSAALRGEREKAGKLAYRAALMKLDDEPLAKEAMRLMNSAGLDRQMLELAEKLPARIRGLGRIRLLLAYAYLRQGEVKETERLLYGMEGEPSLEVPDLREGEASITSLWFDLEETKAKIEGKPFDRQAAQPPAQFDFRAGQ